MAPLPFSIAAGPVGASIVVDGVDVSDHVRAARVDIGVDVPTRLVVDLRADGRIEAEGIVEVVRDTAATGDAVRSLDPDQVRTAVDQRIGQAPIAALYLDVIADMLDREDPR